MDIKRVTWIAGVALGLAIAVAACNGEPPAEDPRPVEQQQEPAEENTEVSKPCWGDYNDERSWLFDLSLSQEQADMVFTGCTFSTLDYEEPVTLGEIEVFAEYFYAQEECAWSTEPLTPECDMLLNGPQLTLDMVRENNLTADDVRNRGLIDE